MTDHELQIVNRIVTFLAVLLFVPLAMPATTTPPGKAGVGNDWVLLLENNSQGKETKP